jgi:hypothetical protein
MRSSIDAWLQSICSTPILLCTQSMYQFLCFDANMPPPYLEIQWRKSINTPSDEMDMVRHKIIGTKFNPII